VPHYRALEIVASGAFVHLEQMAHDHWWMGLEAGGKYFHPNFGVQGGRLWVRLSDQGDENAEWEGDSRERPIPGVDEQALGRCLGPIQIEGFKPTFAAKPRGTGASLIYWPVGAACAGAGAIFFTAAFLTAAFFTAAFFVTAFFAGAFAAAFCKRHRFFVAAMILAIPSLLIRRFGLGAFGTAGADGSDSPLILAHLAFCAIAIFRLEAALNFLRFLVGASGVVAVSAGPGERMARSWAIWASILVFCDS
jgi:hypothetical protein